MSQTPSKPFLTFPRMLLFAVTTGILVGNLYYIQPLLGLLAREFGHDITDIGYLTTCTQIGYAIGILFIVPLGDVLNRRNLLTTVMSANVVGLVVAALAPNYVIFACASLFIGITTCGIMVVVPYVASHAEEFRRGQAVGTVMTGMLLGVLLARTVSGFLGEVAGWRATYLIAAGAVTVLMLALRLIMPPEQQRGELHYKALLLSIVSIAREQPVLRLRAFFGFLGFCTFNILWTGLTFLLSGAPYNYTSDKIGLFGLIGAAGTLSANLAGRMVDKGHAAKATHGYAVVLLLSWLIMGLGSHYLWVIIIGVFFLDIAVQGLQITNQSMIYRVGPTAGARATTVYIFSIFMGASLGSAAASASYAWGGWTGLCIMGGAMPAILGLTWAYVRWRKLPSSAA